MNSGTHTWQATRAAVQATTTQRVQNGEKQMKSSLVEQREREEPVTRPWSVLSVVEKGPTPDFDNDMEFVGRTKANEAAEARAQRGSGRIVGLQDASRSRLFGMHWALRRQSSPGGPTAQQLQRTT